MCICVLYSPAVCEEEESLSEYITLNFHVIIQSYTIIQKFDVMEDCFFLVLKEVLYAHKACI